jgi:acetyl-CoA acyltransferase
VPMMGFNPLPHPELAERYREAYVSMGETAENLARKYQIPRSQQERFAVESHRKAAAARAEGRFQDEIVPIRRPDGGTVA